MNYVLSSKGKTLKTIALESPETYGYHSTFGFVSETAAQARSALRKRLGLKTGDWKARFKIVPNSLNWEMSAMDGCAVVPTQDGWNLTIGSEMFHLGLPKASHAEAIIPTEEPRQSYRLVWLALLLISFMGLIPFFAIEREPAPVPIPEPTVVQVVPEKQKAVDFAKSSQQEMTKLLSRIEKKGQKKEMSGGAAVQENFGFLGLLGKSTLKKALGGMPSKALETSPGAGESGKEGSGGELLVGIGMGLKRATVGNTGVQGLGGIGNAGRGGGEGGYGTKFIGSGGTGNSLSAPGDGRSLAKVALAKDMVLDGGLDRNVIQATIEKYMSQVRACYESGLLKSPGLTGQVTMEFEIGSKGLLHYSRVKRTSLHHDGVENCIRSRMLTWQFPEPLGGVNVKAAYSFALQPMGKS